ncbi:cytochrome ubiquinol oxidase subunit I [Methylomonas sp. AM2-LC]|uniref:cytochrome ubiquinol oxidase subunit I n=1 Tax=Methylomonas sp. AM2-LC TaxID=3153301 RepID=UPI003264FF60
MISETLVELSRWQFAITAMCHFLFVPLTLGLALMLAGLESLYVITTKSYYLDACRFWGRIFVINFALGVVTRLALMFQFGSHGSYFSYYVGDVFALPLAVEILTVFFLTCLLCGPYWYGWERLSKSQHLMTTWLLVLAVNLSAISILTASAWMQNPVGATFNYQSFRIELSDLSQFLHNPIIYSKALHSISACYVTAAATVMAISASLLLKQADNQVARCSFKLAALVGLVSSLLVCVGDSTPELGTPVQNLKLSALNSSDISQQLPSIEMHIRNGIKAYAVLEELRDEKTDPQLQVDFQHFNADLGYALLLKHWTEHVTAATDQQIADAVKFCLPAAANRLHWLNWLMMTVGILNIGIFSVALWNSYTKSKYVMWSLKLSVYLAPLSWLACIAGWYIAEAGIQPWAIAGVLPTFLSVSSLSIPDLVISLFTQYLAFLGLLAVGFFLIRQSIQMQNSNIGNQEFIHEL